MDVKAGLNGCELFYNVMLSDFLCNVGCFITTFIVCNVFLIDIFKGVVTLLNIELATI